MAHQVDDLRTLTLVGHGGSGKTALLDAMAFAAGASSRHGSTADGSSISDTEPEEKDRKQTLTSHLFHLPWKGKICEFLDTPGHPDFLADALSSFYAVETALFTIDAASGATFNARKLWFRAEQTGKGRILVLTKLDHENLDFTNIVANLKETFGDKIVPITVPDRTGKDFSSVTNLLKEGDGDTRSVLEERIAEADDELMERYFEAGELGAEDFARFFPKAIAAGTVVPLFSVNAPGMTGVEDLLDFLSEFAPSPSQSGGVKAAPEPEGEPGISVLPDPGGPVVGRVFKIVSDPFVGKMSFVRLHRGTLKGDETVSVAGGGQVKLNGLLSMQGKETETLDRAVPGTIFVLAKVEGLSLGDTIVQGGEVVHLPPMKFPSPMVAVAVTPKSRSDEQKIGSAFEKLATEDPTLHVFRDQATGEMVVEGLSTLHLDVTFAKLSRRFKVEIETHVPKIPYRETIQAPAEGHHRHKKQSGGRGQFGEVFLRIKPLDRGQGYEFIDSIYGGAIPRQFIPEVDKGIQNVMAKGILAGYPIVDCSAEVYDGKFHDVDSDQISFQLAGGRAFADAFEKAKPIILEPVMNLEIHVPSRFTGDITSNLANQRARMTGMSAEGDDQIIKCLMPLKEARGYQTQLRSITSGEGSFTMEFSHYEPVPANLAQEIIAQAKKDKD